MYCKNCGEAVNENQAICLKCGVEVGKGSSYCHNCGNAVSAEAVICVNCGAAISRNNTCKSNPNINGIKKRAVATAILLSIVTCGIYAIYWFISLTNEYNRASGRENDTNGGISFLLSIVTCGIYGIYWAYKLGEKRDIITGEKNSTSILYLVLAIFGLNIVVYGLAQDSLNKLIENE